MLVPLDARLNHRTNPRALPWLFAMFLAMVALPAHAADSWDTIADGCIKALGTPDKSDAKRLLSCADTFSADARLDKLSSGDKSAIEKGLHWLYDNGDDTAARIAREGLMRLGVNLPARSSKGDPGRAAGGTTAQSEPERKKYDPPEAKDSERKAADKMSDDAVKLLKKKKWADGAKILDKALDKDPRGEKVLYNLACAEANLDGKHGKANEHLQDLADLGTDEATKRLLKARSDPDLEPLHDLADYKRVTGYARILVVNTVGTPGEKGVENIQKLLVKLDHRKADEKDEEKAQDSPSLQFKPHAKAQSALLADLLKATKLDLIQGESKYDIIVRWGTKIENGKAVSLGPDTADEAIADARKKQNKVLAQPDAALNKVNKVLNTPDHAYSEAQAAEKRVEGTVNKAKGAVEKMKGLGEKLNKL
jgi:hypothetical protein